MKIVFTGGVTGGHFYPIIAVAEEIREICKQKKLIEPTLYFLSPAPYNEKILFDNKIIYKKVPAGKMRLYPSILNFLDIFVTGIGLIKALWTMFWIYPDVVFSKGGGGSFPIVWASNILKIPVIVHESDSAPGRTNVWAAKRAKKIAVSYPEAAQFFQKDKVAWTGNPIRKNLKVAVTEGAKEYLDLETSVPTILILGGSQGAKVINEVITDALPELIKEFQIIHQVGKNSFSEISELSKIILQNSQYAHRYKLFPYLDDLALKMSAGAADLIISRAGSTIFEIANWHKPSILIPITESHDDHQRKNAYIYARTGAGTVIEESNLSDSILITEIKRILDNKDIKDSMIAAASDFAKPEAALTIAKELLELGLNH
ncbi:MAG TPA: UDP-N-acetylglucosamine--N-acetylmuramyl-(pentapeptide) pyrophosphoryl-undecaprenol N-acetylglucosamine transferase [Candidatus Paceibacterota bacterium]|nr:UDP-N-acetylglucosamine--N-acetylmuramyl-(pentapeptide) pyrophosphoryl-undecaprenol N-acetylglucosamine transferase [Candidatus Paceibacterota bacterium]HRZ34559.1 UDP-N-acetylglucosamine--N-acetylmuramyl-(pentapeptide) pyrophosphoryl-undecaprenol N-acetylglucosamine transferase [Candidatus Paceibacterota bacterium]